MIYSDRWNIQFNGVLSREVTENPIEYNLIIPTVLART
jgi:hypothetical protein